MITSFTKHIVLLALLLLSFKIYSQESVIKMVVVEDTETETKTDYSRLRKAIKINPLLFFRGDIPLYYEMNISSKFAAEVGVGLTLTDYFFEPWSKTLNDKLDKEPTMDFGYSFRTGIRYYASDFSFEPEGIYFGLEYRIQQYNSQFEFDNSAIMPNKQLSATNYDGMLLFGYLSNVEENFFFEPYVGLGFRKQVYDNISNNGQGNYTFSKEESIAPSLSLGFKLGISF